MSKRKDIIYVSSDKENHSITFEQPMEFLLKRYQTHKNPFELLNYLDQEQPKKIAIVDKGIRTLLEEMRPECIVSYQKDLKTGARLYKMNWKNKIQ